MVLQTRLMAAMASQAFLATFNGLDFGTNGDAVTFAPGTGAVTDGGGNPTVVDLGVATSSSCTDKISPRRCSASLLV